MTNHTTTDFPRIGVGVLLLNGENQILLGRRKNAHGESTWGPPGGHLEFGESFEACAIRETLEETGVAIENPRFFAMSNDVFKAENKHYVSLFMTARLLNNQTIQNLEPHKVENWQWFSLDALPEDLFIPLKSLKAGLGYGNKLEELI